MSTNVNFVASTREWLSIGKSINEIINNSPEFCAQTNLLYRKNCQLEKFQDKSAIFICPLFELLGNKIQPIGLETTRTIRNCGQGEDYSSVFMYIVNNKNELPDPYRPENPKKGYANALLGNPDFGDVDKATLFAELIYENKHNSAAISERLFFQSQK